MSYQTDASITINKQRTDSWIEWLFHYKKTDVYNKKALIVCLPMIRIDKKHNVSLASSGVIAINPSWNSYTLRILPSTSFAASAFHQE